MDRRTIIIVSSVIVLTGLFFYLSLQGPTTDRSLIGTGITAHRVTFNGEATPAADVSVPFTRKNDDFTVANVAIDLNKNGEIAAYDTENGVQEEWIVKNSRAKVIEAGNTFSFELVDRAADARTDMPLVAVLSKEPLEDWDGTVPTTQAAAAQQIVLSRFIDEDFGGLFHPVEQEGEFLAGQAGIMTPHTDPADGPRAPSPVDVDLTVTSVEDPEPYLTDLTAGDLGDIGAQVAEAAEAIGAEVAAAQMPAEGADFEVFQPGVPDMNQGEMECVPTSISNGLHWLGERYGFSDRLPDEQNDTMGELKDDLGWTRENGAGMGQSFLDAKVAFTERHDLPIHTHRIGGMFDDDIVRKIAVELRNGQAVEVGIGYYRWDDGDEEWKRSGGHMMSGVGAFGSNSETYLGVHDPLSQDPGRLDMYHVNDSRIYDYRYRGNSAVFIEFAYAQSPNQAWVEEYPPSIDLDVSGMAEGADLQNTWFVDMIRIGQAWFPVKQFHKFTGDTEEECDAEEHWHANTGQAWGIDLSEHDYFDLNPERIRDRNASVVGWTDPENCGAGKTAEVEQGNIMVSRSEALDLLGRIIE